MDNSNKAIAARWNLNRQVVDSLGWQLKKLDTPEIASGKDEVGKDFRIELWWTLVDGKGEAVMDVWQTPDLVWEHSPIPNYSEELEEAFTLLDTLPSDFTPRLVRMLKPLNGDISFFWRAMIIDNITHQQFEGEADYPSEAIVHCWLEWHRRTS